MATIQIREVPEPAYEILRARARTRGQSIQAYMREQVVALAAQPTKEEALARIEALLAEQGPGDAPDPEAILAGLDADRR